jgi:hypothetical protein
MAIRSSRILLRTIYLHHQDRMMNGHHDPRTTHGECWCIPSVKPIRLIERASILLPSGPRYLLAWFMSYDFFCSLCLEDSLLESFCFEWLRSLLLVRWERTLTGHDPSSTLGVEEESCLATYFLFSSKNYQQASSLANLDTTNSHFRPTPRWQRRSPRSHY